ncbi:Tumor necrosis factor [Bagarius yarrelli]|uniref:Lymphotoxin-alpha n=1 Tax=Bagarius yarrelli TaxID=175774 RepID=A0A556U5Z3_BAGYA|nr:Tumor necrosis factor [Bagarius yarrelli]
MENQKVTAADIEAALGEVYQPTVETVKPSRSWTWTIVGVVVLLSLGAVASLCFAWHFTKKHHDEPVRQQQSTTSTGKKPDIIHQNCLNHVAVDVYHMWARKTNKVSLSVVDVSGPQKMLTQIAKSTKAAIHLHASDRLPEKSSPRWMSDVDQSFTKGGLRLEDNSILIPHDGLYFVYSQASYKLFCKSNEEDNEEESSNIHLSYNIRWSSPTSPSKTKRFLLSGVKTMCQTKVEEQMNGHTVYDSIYLGAVFQLYKGDKLSTESNHLADIVGRSSKTFFGVFEL